MFPRPSDMTFDLAFLKIQYLDTYYEHVTIISTMGWMIKGPEFSPDREKNFLFYIS
jgi:hypothetical protein